MTFRTVATKIIKYGRQVFQNLPKTREVPVGVPGVGVKAENAAIQAARGRLGPTPGSRGGLVRAAVGRVTNSLAAELRRSSAWGLVTGGPRPVLSRLALVGLSLGAGVGRTAPRDKQMDVYDSVCKEIKNLFPYQEESLALRPGLDPQDLNINNFEFGPLIGQGCNSAVYAARLKEPDFQPAWPDCAEIIEANLLNNIMQETEEDGGEEEEGEGEGSFVILCEGGEEAMDSEVTMLDNLLEEWELHSAVLSEDGADDAIQDGCHPVTESLDDDGHDYPTTAGLDQYDLAIKMMFNYEYDAGTEVGCVPAAMLPELTPTNRVPVHGMRTWQNGNHVKKKRLKVHPNIVDMPGYFVGATPLLPGAMERYPNALPQKYNQEGGLGAEHTLFLVMSRYNCTLREYLSSRGSAGVAPACSLLLLTQLVEGLAYLSLHAVAHRDLKSDNLLLVSGLDPPVLSIGDFGCCLDRPDGSLRLPYPREGVDRGGNGTLMAPEIAAAEAGFGVTLDFSKSDIWAAGALAYEIFHADNPFYRAAGGLSLDSRTYRDEDLPDLPEAVPNTLKAVIQMMLRRNPEQRVSATLAGNLLQLYLWAPPQWFRGAAAPPGGESVMRWLLAQAAEVYCRGWHVSRGAIHVTELCVRSAFLARADFAEIMAAAEMLHSLANASNR